MIGREIGNYRITQRLGQGGVGQVFAGVDQMLNRPVAIKALHAEFGRDPGVLARFRSEAESLARLNHPNITTLYSLQREGDELFMIMELVRGQTLEALLLNCRQLSEHEALAVTAQVLDGLGYAHNAGVIHRDVKTGNLMVAPSGLLKIMDFGIARVRGSGRLTRQGHIVGTLAYMSPEQIRGEEGDERSDLYNLAIVLYELLSGDPPFVSDSEYALIRAQVEAAPPRLIGRVSGVRPEIEDAVMRALAKHPVDRFATAAEFGRALGVSDLGGKATDVVREGLGSVVFKATRIGIAAVAKPLHDEGDVPGRPAARATRLAHSSERKPPKTHIAQSRASGSRSRLTETKRRAAEEERQRWEQQEAEAKRRATEEERQRWEQQEAEAKRRATEEERQRWEQQQAEAKRRATEEERQRWEQQEAEAKRRATEEERQRWEQQEAEAKRRATEEERRREPAPPSSRKQWAGLKRALAFDREKRTPSIEPFVSELRGGQIASLRATLTATGIVAIFIAAAGVGYTLWPRHQQEPVALTSAPLPPEAPRREEPAVIEPELPPQRLPEAVAAIRPPQPPEKPETQPVPPDTVVVERLLSNVRCSALEAVVRGRTLVVDGYSGDRQSLAAVLEPLARAAGGVAISTDQVREMDPLYCQPVEVLRPFVEANRDRNLSLAVSTTGTNGGFREGDELVLAIKASEHHSYIYVDYFSLDGNVVHMLPNPASRDNRLAASGQTTLGNGGPGGSWTVGEPFGTELITVISSPEPLFSKVRQEVEPSAGYLADLHKALARAVEPAGTAGIAAKVSFIHTERPPETVERLLSNVRCSALEAVVRGRTLVVDGYSGDRQSLAAVLEPLARAAGGVAISTDQVREMDPLYCQPVEVLRPFVEANRDRNLSLAVSTTGTNGGFREGDELVLAIKASEHHSYIYVDYFSLDGNVVHMLPNPASRDNRLAASGQTTLGNGGPGGSWTVGEPFGTELITVISSPKPLFSKVRQEVEPSAGYLADLHKALARAVEPAGTAGIAAAVSFIHTERQS